MKPPTPRRVIVRRPVTPFSGDPSDSFGGPTHMVTANVGGGTVCTAACGLVARAPNTRGKGDPAKFTVWTSWVTCLACVAMHGVSG